MTLVSAIQNNYFTFTSYLKRTAQYKMILYFIYKKTFYALSKTKGMTSTLEAMTDMFGKLVKVKMRQETHRNKRG